MNELVCLTAISSSVEGKIDSLCQAQKWIWRIRYIQLMQSVHW